MKALMDGEGSFTARGPITDDHPVPTNFTSKIVSNGQTSDVTMVLDEGSVKELAATPLSSSGRVPVTEANRQGIIDPLTAMLFWAVAPGAFSQETCRRTLPIFDGHQRYDLKLAFKRMDKVTAEKGYAGPVVVCSLRYEPIVGHISSNALVKYLSEGREMEVALAPVAGTRLLAPFRLSVVSILANLVIEASRFEATARPFDAQRLPIQRHSDPVFGDIVFGTGCRKGNSLRELRVRATLRRLATNRGRGRRQGEVAAVQLVKHADAEPAAGLPERKLVPTQQKR